MAEEMEAEEAERLVRAICRMRWERDAAIDEMQRLGVELEKMRNNIDFLIRETSEAWKRLVPLEPVGVSGKANNDG